MAGYRKRVRLGDILVEYDYITQEQLEDALSQQKEKGKLLGEMLIELNYISEEDMMRALQTQLGLEFVDLRNYEIDEKAVAMVGEQLVRKYKLLPIAISKFTANVLIVAMSDPMNIFAMDDLSIVTGMQVEPVLAMPSHIDAMIDRYFGKQQAQAMAEQFKKEQEIYMTEEEAEESLRRDDVENSPIVQLVNNIIEQAVRQRASDIHIEPFEFNVRIRYRVDGSLREVATYDKALFSAMIARLKIMSNMDISEKRKPQDGRITLMVDMREWDIRVSNLPTVYGEKVVMRLASKEGFKKDKRDLGMRPEDLEKFDNILKNPNGIILVTGPTGSGKSTTLYTALSELNTEDVNIVTVEDPVEANIDGVNQVNVNVKADMTFASGLRSILRQDPDIIMIGEIRDGETAEIAVRASITGHLVVSTLHTNSTAGTVGRLVDMGIEPYLLGDSLVGIIAQRLVRRLCKCKSTRPATEDEVRQLGAKPGEQIMVCEPVGCPECDEIGYKGRIGIYEIMTITKAVKDAIASGAGADEIKKVAESEGMSSLRASAAKYVKEGVTSFSELIKVTYNADEA